MGENNKKIYAEFGFGNESFFSTEFESGLEEYRKKGFIIPEDIKEFYLRLWIFKRVFIFSTRDFFKITKKNKNKFKIIFGIGGEG